VRAASVALLIFGFASLFATGPQDPPATLDASEAAEIDEFSALGRKISPLSAVRESFKPEILKVEGAFTGGTCSMDGEEEECPISNMTEDLLTGVFPGGETRCLLGNTPYIFQVIRGDSDKLLLYFQGGGACWDTATATAKLCVQAVADEGRVGIFNRENPANPYKNYTVIIISYCSGDGHIGHADRDWTILSAPTLEAKQRGYINARSAIDWAKKNVGDVQLESLIITGSSAGALGTQFWARKLLGEFSWKDAAVIADSYAAIFPVGVQGGMMKDFGLCERGLLTDGLHFLCSTGTIDIQQVYEAAMREYPEVAFASLDSKIDFVQIAFFKVVHKSRLGYLDFVGPRDFASMLRTVYSRYNLYPNWVSFSVNDGQHMYLNNDVMYQTTPVGNQVTSRNGMAGKLLAFAGSTINGDDMPLVDWLSEFPVRRGHSVKTHCASVTPKAPELPKPQHLRSGFLGLITNQIGHIAHTAKDGAQHLVKPVVHTVASSLGFELSCSSLAHSKVFTHVR